MAWSLSLDTISQDQLVKICSEVFLYKDAAKFDMWRTPSCKKPGKNITFANTVGDLKSGTIWNSDFLKVGFQMIQFSNGRALATAIAIVPTIWQPSHFKSSIKEWHIWTSEVLEINLPFLIKELCEKFYYLVSLHFYFYRCNIEINVTSTVTLPLSIYLG